MTSLVDAIYQTEYNPFKYGEFLASFYLNLQGVERNLLLSQLVIPLCSHPVYKEKIERAVFKNNGGSTIWTIFSDKIPLYDLQERIDNFKQLTDQSLQYCLINDWIIINSDSLAISVENPDEIKFVEQKSAKNLGKIFSNLSVIEVYALLGVTPR